MSNQQISNNAKNLRRELNNLKANPELKKPEKTGIIQEIFFTAKRVLQGIFRNKGPNEEKPLHTPNPLYETPPGMNDVKPSHIENPLYDGEHNYEELPERRENLYETMSNLGIKKPDLPPPSVDRTKKPLIEGNNSTPKTATPPPIDRADKFDNLAFSAFIKREENKNPSSLTSMGQHPPSTVIPPRIVENMAKIFQQTTTPQKPDTPESHKKKRP